jgi:hypothetical protein
LNFYLFAESALAERMEKFRELCIKITPQHTRDFLSAVDSALKKGWKRATEAEARARSMSRLKLHEEMAYYCCDKRGQRQAALVAIYRRDPQQLYVSNVVPTELSELSHRQYNAILKDFYDEILANVRGSFRVSVVLASNQLRVEDLMPAETFKLLRAFSSSANRSTGSAHPADGELWQTFLVALSRGQHKLDSHSLLRWLIEVEGWPGEVAQDLGSEFEFGMELLARAQAS